MNRFLGSVSRIGLSSAGNALLAGMASAVAVAGIGLTALYLLENVTETPAIRDLQCLVGIERSDCPRQMAELDGLRADHDQLLTRNREAVAELAAERARLAAMRQHIAHLEGAISGEMVFAEGPPVAGLTVIVGTIYRDHAARSQVVRSLCWAIQDSVGLDPRLTLAEMDGSGAVRAIPVDAFDRSAMNVTEADVVTARTACPWPDIRS